MIVVTLDKMQCPYVRLSPLDSVSNFQEEEQKDKKRENPFFCPRINQCKSCVIGGNLSLSSLLPYLKMVLFHDEFHSCPVVLFPMMYELIPRLSAFSRIKGISCI